MKAIEDMKKAGAEIIDPAPVDLSQVRRDQNAGVCMGFKYDINAYLAAQGNRVPVHNQDEIIKSQRFHPSVQPRLERAQQSTPQGPDSDACKSEMAYRPIKYKSHESSDALKFLTRRFQLLENRFHLISELSFWREA